jgi:hypothetical protein
VHRPHAPRQPLRLDAPRTGSTQPQHHPRRYRPAPKPHLVATASNRSHQTRAT